jgi:hypothetical protein
MVGNCVSEAKVVAADVMRGDLLVHFSDGESVLFQAEFLKQVRHEHGNRLLSDDNDEGDDESEPGNAVRR